MNERFIIYLAELVEVCERHPLVIGLVLMGSTADRKRVDEWSDHDFAVICVTGAEERLRDDLAWLPWHEDLVACTREDHDGFKGIYRDGSVIEFAVTPIADLAGFHANAWEVAYGDDELTETMRAVSRKKKPMDSVKTGRDATVFLASLLIGVGRARRGEALSASGSIRGLALDHLLVLFRTFVPATQLERLDDLDQRRRFEVVYPRLALDIGLALEKPVEGCARDLLKIAEEQLGHWDGWPTEAAGVVRRRLGWQS